MRWGYEMAPTARTGIYRLKTGGFYVRARVTNLTGKRPEISAVLHDAKTLMEAQAELDRRVDAALEAVQGRPRTTQTWRDFAISRLQQRIRLGKIESESTVEWWQSAVPIFAEQWGDHEAPAVTKHHIEAFMNGPLAKWMSEGRTTLRKRRVDGELVMKPFTVVIKPVTANGWLRVLRTISHAIKEKYELARSAFDGIEFFNEGRTYTVEEPNALPPDFLPRFMTIARAKFPQWYPMLLLGFVTGLRPSSIRPLRRKGPHADLDWMTGRLLIRRSHSRKQTVMERTKTKVDNELVLPAEVLEVLRAHSDALTGAAAESDLLFPARDGKLRSRGALMKPIAAIAKEMGIPFKLTPRAMRRTFNDLAREAGIHDAVTRSISGHQTEAMQLRYSTARGEEKRDALTRVHGFMAEKGDPKDG